MAPACSRSTRATAPAAKSPSWTRPASCSTTAWSTHQAARHDVAGTKRELARLVKKDGVNTTIVIGNGTASRETEEVVAEFIAEQAPGLRYTIVNEAGASVYSASNSRAKNIPTWTSPCVAP